MGKIPCKKWKLLLVLAVLLVCLGGCSESWQTQGKSGNWETADGGRGEAVFDAARPPEYNGELSVTVHNNQPYFSDSDLTKEAFEEYSELDGLGRCGAAYANICEELMPKEERGAIGHIKPSGWHTVKYNDLIDGNYLYNRCHLIGYQLAGENANEKNLITGTRAMNTEGMLPYENQVADYVKETKNHVLYRVTPIFEGDNLVASGVLMEAESVEDKGKGVCFCVYVFNCQPGIAIDYATGESWREPEGSNGEKTADSKSDISGKYSQKETSWKNSQETENTYILNTNTHKFHKPDCKSAETMAEGNKQTVTKTREAVLLDGYEPCKQCNP